MLNALPDEGGMGRNLSPAIPSPRRVVELVGLTHINRHPPSRTGKTNDVEPGVVVVGIGVGVAAIASTLQPRDAQAYVVTHIIM